MAAAMKSMITFVVDVSRTMQDPSQGRDSSSKIAVARSFIADQIAYKLLTSKTAEFSIVAYGASETSNFLNTSQGGYEFVNEIVEMAKANGAAIEAVSQIQCSSHEGDLVDGIVVAQDILMRYNSKYKYNRVLVLLTDAETKIEAENCSDLEEVIESMRRNAECCMHVGVIGEAPDDEIAMIKSENAKMLEACTKCTGGVCVVAKNLGELLQLGAIGKGLSSRPMVSKSVLELSPTVKFPITFYNWISKAKVPTLKKQVKRLKAVKVEVAEEGNSSVQRNTIYRHPSDPDLEVGLEDRVKGYRYGSQYIPLTTADEESLSINSAAVMRVLGFLPRDRIPRYHFLEATIVVQGAPSVQSSQLAMQSLYVSMKESNQVCLIRCVKKENSDPYLGVLAPSMTDDGVITMHRLPCSDDIRDYNFPSLKLSKQSNDRLQKKRKLIDEYLDSITENTPSATMMSPPGGSLYSVVEMVRDSCMGVRNSKGSESSQLFANLSDFSVSYPVHGPAAAAAMRDVVEHFDLVKVATTKDKKKQYWSDIDISMEGENEVKVDNNVGASAVAIKIENNNTMTNATVAIPEFTKASLTPVEDFTKAMDAAILANAETTIVSIYETMMTVIELLVVKGGSNAHFRKGLACLSTLRRSAVQEGQHRRFNSFMREKIGPLADSPLHRGFFMLVVQEGLSLISNEEDSASSVTSSEASQFLQGTKPPVQTAVAPPPPPEEDDDIFASMA